MLVQEASLSIKFSRELKNFFFFFIKINDGRKFWTICINAYGTDTSKGILNAVLGCTKAFSTSLPIASARRSWLLNNLEPNFCVRVFKLSAEEEKGRKGFGEGVRASRCRRMLRRFTVVS